jgi:hypothetical protein
MGKEFGDLVKDHKLVITKENISWTKSMVMDNLNGQVEINIEGPSVMMRDTDAEK